MKGNGEMVFCNSTSYLNRKIFDKLKNKKALRNYNIQSYCMNGRNRGVVEQFQVLIRPIWKQEQIPSRLKTKYDHDTSPKKSLKE